MRTKRKLKNNWYNLVTFRDYREQGLCLRRDRTDWVLDQDWNPGRVFSERNRGEACATVVLYTLGHYTFNSMVSKTWGHLILDGSQRGFT